MKFKDFNKEDFCNPDVQNAFAIELEVSVEDEGLHYNYKNESDKIIEFLGVHDLSTEDRLKLLDEVADRYKDTFPVGEMGSRISGGVHFLLLGDFDGLYGRDCDTLKKNLLNCPLYCKIKDNKFYSRYLGDYCNFDKLTHLDSDEKRTPVTLKSELYSNGGYLDGIEFRLNNVIDERLLGYYQAQTILFKEGIELKELPENAYLKIGDKNSYEDKEVISVDELKACYSPTNGELTIIKENIKTIFETLEKNNLPNSKKALEEYLIQYGILENKITF